MFLGLVLLAMAIAYLLMVLVGSYFVTRRLRTRSLRWFSQIIVIVLLLALPFTDEMVGRLYFNHLCKTSAGLEVHETVDLEPKFYDKNGSPKFIDSEGAFDSSVFNGRYEFKTQSQYNYVNFVRMRKRTYLIIDKVRGRILGTYTNYFYFGGWLVNNLGYQVRGIHCGPIKGGLYEGMISKILQPAER